MYWPKSKTDSFDLRTATFSLAVNRADEINGCLWYLPGSHKLRGTYAGRVGVMDGSRPLGGGVIDVAVLPEDLPRRHFLVLNAGDATCMFRREPPLAHASKTPHRKNKPEPEPYTPLTLPKQFTRNGYSTGPKQTAQRTARGTR